MQLKSSELELEMRGFVDESQLVIPQKIDNSLLNELLHSEIATQRTAAAMIIKKENKKEFIGGLIQNLQKEVKLYTRIALSDALVSFGPDILPHILPSLARIGKNQHQMLPTVPFKKDNYPLPRDIVARILVRIGLPSVIAIHNTIRNMDREQKLEAVDVLGHISFYTGNLQSFPVLFSMFKENSDDSLMKWKIIRAFSAFNIAEVKYVLQNVIADCKQDALVWEATRSLRLITEKNAKPRKEVC